MDTPTIGCSTVREVYPYQAPDRVETFAAWSPNTTTAPTIVPLPAPTTGANPPVVIALRAEEV